MAHIRRLKSGRWQATVRLPDGQRRSHSDPLRSVVAGWAAEIERDVRRGEAVDPRAGDATVGELWPKTRDSRRLELASRRRDDSHWRVHVAPRWQDTPVAVIVQPDVEAWVISMERAGVGAATVQGAVGVLRAVCRYAVKARLIRANPVPTGPGELNMPRRPAHLDRVLGRDEDEPLLAALDEVAGGRPHGRLLAQMLLYLGLRWSEAAAVAPERIRRREALLDVGPVVERDAGIRPYPKSDAGVRTVPIPDWLWPAVRERTLATPPGGLLVPAPAGGVLRYPTWRRRVWVPALRRAGLAEPAPTPHDLRHTYGTRLAEARVPPHEIKDLMGHESLRSVERYLHAGVDRFARAREAMRPQSTSGGPASRASTPVDIS